VNVVVPGYVAGTEFFGDTMTEEHDRRLVAQTLVGAQDARLMWRIGGLPGFA
jgi:hypothetical protein